MRRAALLATSAIVAVMASSAAAGERTSCPNGFFDWTVPQTEQAMRVLPRIDAGLDAGAYTVQQLVELGNAIDANGDGVFCLKAVSNLSGSSDKNWGYFYGARDNDSAAS
jgi:hypothetical protein